MRNLKRALSLTLASVMLLGMMVVGSSAAQGYDDVSKDDNVEAIEVLQAIEVMVGDERGFGPERPVNRAEMAVVMALLLNLDYNYYVSTCPFNDVYDWARGPVGACYANGIVSGRGDGIYDPGATVTAVEAASMLMRALGYFRYQNDYEGNFVLSTVKKGSQIRIFDGVGSSASEPMTRNQVAQMVLNALQTGMAEPDGNTLNLATPDGNIYTGKVNYVNVTSNKAFASTISDVKASSAGSTNDGYIVELGEQLYDGKLKLNEYTTDAFERPARYWEFDGQAIGTYVKKELMKAEYTTEVTGKQLYDLLTKDTIADYEFTIAIDGEVEKDILNGNSKPDTFFFSTGNLIRTNTKGVGGTGNGVLTQVFVDPDEPARDAKDGRGTVYITVINTYLAKATDDYDEKREEAEFEVYSLEQLTDGALVKNTENSGSKSPASLKVKNEEINVEDVKEDDIVLVHVAEGEIKEIFDPEVIAETELNSFKNGSWVNNGTKYDYADSTSYDPDVLDDYVDDNMKDTVYNLYLDEYGYMIGIDIVEAATNYVFLTGIDGRTSNLRNKTAEGNVIHMDGTMETVTIKLGDSEYADGDDMTESVAHPLNSLMNTWCKYSTNANGEYVLTEVARTPAQFANAKAGQSWVGDTTASTTTFNYDTIDKKHVSTPGIAGSTVKMAYGNDDSVYINVTTGLITANRVSAAIGAKDSAFIIDDVDSVSVGVQSTNLKALTAYDVWNAASNKGDILNETGDGTTVKQLDSIANGVFNLFGEDGAIIAAVVVGEDDGSTTNYAYVISDKMEQEAYDKSKGEWTWSRKVIVNGEITEVTEVTDGKHPDIENMVRGQWYEMKYKGDGTVKSANLIGWDEDRSGAVDNSPGMIAKRGTVVGEFIADNNGNDTNNSKYIGAVRKHEAAVDKNDTVVLATDLTGTNAKSANGWISVPVDPCYYSINPDDHWDAGWDLENSGTNKITTTGNTLWIETNVADQKDGFAVRNDAKVVLVQDTHTIRNGRVIKTDVMANEYTYTQTGKEALAKMVKDLMDNENFVGFISAVFEGGVATSVVVWDQTPENIDTGNDPTAPEVPADTTTVNLVYKDSVTGNVIGDGKIVDGLKKDDIIYGDELSNYSCQVADYGVKVPAFQKGTKLVTLTLWYDPIVKAADIKEESTGAADNRYGNAYSAAGVTTTVSGKNIGIAINETTMGGQTNKTDVQDMIATEPGGKAGTLYLGITITPPEKTIGAADEKPESMTILTPGFTAPDYREIGGVLAYREYFAVGTFVKNEDDSITITPVAPKTTELTIRWKFSDGSVLVETYNVAITVS